MFDSVSKIIIAWMAGIWSVVLVGIWSVVLVGVICYNEVKKA